MRSSALSPEEEAKNLLYWRGLAPGRWVCASPFAQDECQGPREIPWLLGARKHPETPRSCFCLGQSYSIKTFAVPTSSLVTLNNDFRARFKQPARPPSSFPTRLTLDSGKPGEQGGAQSRYHLRWSLRLGDSQPSALPPWLVSQPRSPPLKLDSLCPELDPALPISLGSQLHVHKPTTHYIPSVQKITIVDWKPSWWPNHSRAPLSPKRGIFLGASMENTGP